VGDVVRSVDGRAASRWDADALRNLPHRPEGTEVTFGLEDGTDRRVVLERYY
jgi:hypothetical protein